MSAIEARRYYRLGAFALIVVIACVVALRPLTRVPGHVHNGLGLTRLALLSEPAADGDTPLKPPSRTVAHVLAPILVSALLIVLKMRRTAFVPVRLRRLKLPSHTSTRSLPTDH